ncbi:cell envelope integrity protein TolA [Xanthomonas sp. XNM01]|uniref:cell envelope integrity protein TolA n=1 Tax=Xanthomonas sp. XNM01 TaxID=2769289 RepID=UPI001CE058B5|nr:cell envelope integrity protein TolA [Xanthomonas sp. XNM01]
MSIRLFSAAALALATLAAGPVRADDADAARERARYGDALREAIRAQWLRPDTVAAGTSCRVRIRQLPGGDVLDAEVMPDCGFDPVGQRSLQAAVLRAQPLPYAGFERVFSRELVVTFTTDDH